MGQLVEAVNSYLVAGWQLAGGARITDAMVADIMALSDEEILKEAAEDGEDVHEIAERAAK